uniref:hypothetical protein n=1 Tax=Streptomyces sp. NBC_00060 TaxID=2975636 RepID=UPI002F909133
MKNDRASSREGRFTAVLGIALVVGLTLAGAAGTSARAQEPPPRIGSASGAPTHLIGVDQ